MLPLCTSGAGWLRNKLPKLEKYTAETKREIHPSVTGINKKHRPGNTVSVENEVHHHDLHCPVTCQESQGLLLKLAPFNQEAFLACNFLKNFPT